MHTQVTTTSAAQLSAAPYSVVLNIAVLTGANGQRVAPTRIQLVPAGQFATRDGRPAAGRAWQLFDEAGQALAAQLNARHAAPHPSFGLDYEHQSLNAEKNGLPAPRSASMRSFEWVSGAGLFATDVQWTDKAAAAVLAKEYEYISPVLLYDSNFVVRDVFNAALVHTPALLDINALDASLSDPVALGASLLSALNSHELNPEGNTVNPLLKALLAALGLPENATEAQGNEAIQALKARAQVGGDALTALAAHTKVDVATFKDAASVTAALSAHATTLSDQVKKETTTSVTAALAAKPGGGSADAATLQMVSDMQAQIVALQATVNGDKVTTLVDDALKARKLLPLQRQWAIDLGKADMAALSAFVANAPVLTPGVGDSQSAGAGGGATGVAALSAEQKLIAAQLGVDPAEYAKTLTASAA